MKQKALHNIQSCCILLNIRIIRKVRDILYTPKSLTKSEKYKKGCWDVTSTKIKRDLQITGDLDYDFWLTIETNPKIIDFCERPTVNDGNMAFMEIAPSFWIKYSDHSERFVKTYYSNVKNPILLKKIQEEKLWIHNWNETNAIKYITVDDQVIRNNYILLSNQKLIISFVANHRHPLDLDKFIVKRSVLNVRKSLYALSEEISNRISSDRLIEILCWMLYSGEISGNIDKVPIGPKTEVWYDG